MESYQESMLKALVAVAWADGKMDAEEGEVIDALISAFDLRGADAEGVREYARTKRSLDEVSVAGLSVEDKRLLLQHAVILSHIDGNQSADEVEAVHALTVKLELPPAEAKELVTQANFRAKRLLDLL